MIGAGYPAEWYRRDEVVRSESARIVSLHEFGDRDPSWLFHDARPKPYPRKNYDKNTWLGMLRAAASRFAAMLL